MQLGVRLVEHEVAVVDLHFEDGERQRFVLYACRVTLFVLQQVLLALDYLFATLLKRAFLRSQRLLCREGVAAFRGSELAVGLLVALARGSAVGALAMLFARFSLLSILAHAF